MNEDERIETLAAILKDSDPEGCDDQWSYEPQARAMLADNRFATLFQGGVS